MNNTKQSITQEGLDQLKSEVEARKEKLKEVADKIDEARQQGDLSENAAYSAALAEKELQESKIRELEEKIGSVVVVKGNSNNNVADLGETVNVKRISDGRTLEYILVGDTESDPTNHKISINSPIGMALVGKKKGDKVKVSFPSGEEEFIIESID